MLPGIGVFGTGKAVRVLVSCLRTRGFKVEAIWGRTIEDARELAQELDIPFYTSKEDEVLLRKSVDLVCILCSPHLHAQIAVKALGIGKHVLCDRPAGLTQTEVLKMVKAAQYYPTLISILCHSLRFLPAYVHMKRQIQDGYVGKVQIIEARVNCGTLLHDRYDWTSEDLMGGGVLNTLGSHVIDIAAFVTGLRASRAHGLVRTFTKTTDTVRGIRQVSSDDFCTFQLELPDGACATVTLNSHCSGQFTQELLVCGSKGNLVVRSGDLHGQKRGGKDEVLYLDVEDLNQKPDSGVPKPHVKGLVKMVGALRDAFAGRGSGQVWGKEPVSSAATFEDGLYIQAVIDAVRQSSKTREWVQVELLQDDAKCRSNFYHLHRMDSGQM
ncbi:glucose-fructose oxidoreductase domain-containing protein 2-like [Ornithodoros turicata]|uniref:Putative oxidoreductase n=1 Tax=Ornithodoros turicata TaxID=34597 RepID=A0A2R5L8I6_9ACAR